MTALLPPRLAVSLLSFFLLTPVLRAEPQWIWSQASAVAQERQTFRKSFTVTGEVKSATLVVTCDNSATARLNGETVLENKAWQNPTRVDVAKKLRAGANERVIEGRNETG